MASARAWGAMLPMLDWIIRPNSACLRLVRSTSLPRASVMRRALPKAEATEPESTAPITIPIAMFFDISEAFFPECRHDR